MAIKLICKEKTTFDQKKYLFKTELIKITVKHRFYRMKFVKNLKDSNEEHFKAYFRPFIFKNSDLGQSSENRAYS